MDELLGGGPPVEPFEQRVYTKEQFDARLEGLTGFQAIYDEVEKIRKEEDVILAERAKSTKAAADEFSPEVSPRPVDDPHGMRFTDEEMAALTTTDDEASIALAFATATPEKLALLKAKSDDKTV